MANFQAYNDKVWFLAPLKFFNPTTSVTTTTVPSGTTLTATSSLPNSLQALINVNAGEASVELIPKVQASPGISVTISGDGVTSATFLVDVVADPNPPLTIVLDTTQTDATTTPQAIPTNPGP